MRRREFIQVALVPLATVRPRLASAQARTARIGLLAPGSSATTAEFVEELKDGLREHGLFDGENVRLERHSARRIRRSMTSPSSSFART
jgi:hypothetical protein